MRRTASGAAAPLEGLGHRVDRLARDENVPLRGVALSRAASRPVEAFLAGVGRRASLGVDDPHLSMVAALVLARELVDDLLGGEAFAKQLEPVRPVARIGIRLCRDRHRRAARAQGTTEPTERNFDWTATPHCSASRSTATIE